jgi:hypothetical protein
VGRPAPLFHEAPQRHHDRHLGDDRDRLSRRQGGGHAEVHDDVLNPASGVSDAGRASRRARAARPRRPPAWQASGVGRRGIRYPGPASSGYPVPAGWPPSGIRVLFRVSDTRRGARGGDSRGRHRGERPLTGSDPGAVGPAEAFATPPALVVGPKLSVIHEKDRALGNLFGLFLPSGGGWEHMNNACNFNGLTLGSAPLGRR